MAWSAIYVALAAVGIDVGWQPLPAGGFEYIIHLEPDALSSLRDGLEIHSQVPPFLRDFRVCRILVSNQPPPRLGEPESHAGPDLQASNKPAGLAEPGPALAGPPPQAKPLSAQQAGGTITFPPPPDPRGAGLAPLPSEGLESAPGAAPSDGQKPRLENPIPDPFRPADGAGGERPQSPATAATPEDPKAAPQTPSREPNATPTSNDPWIDPARAPNWLLGTALGLFVSLGGNAYLGYLAWGFRGRYERAIERLKTAVSARA